MILAGLAAALFREERIRTTEAKAKRMRPVAEKLITLGKAGDVHARRQVLAVIEDRDVVHKLFDDIAPRFAERNGGYTRIVKLGPRKGDAAPMAIIELVEGAVVTSTGETEAKRRRGVLRRRKKQEGAEATPTRGRRTKASTKTDEDVSPGSESAEDSTATDVADEAETLAESPEAATDASSDAEADIEAAEEGAEMPSEDATKEGEEK